MAKVKAQSVDDYIDAQPLAVRPLLERVRRTLAKAVPDAEECFSYSIPAFRLGGRIVLYFAAWKDHYSIYPASDAMVAAFEGALDAYRVSKGTLRFPLAEPVPVTLIARIAKYQVTELAGRTRQGKPKRTSTSDPSKSARRAR